MFKQLTLHKFYITKNKYQFRTTSIDFLEYRILFVNVKIQKNKIKFIRT